LAPRALPSESQPHGYGAGQKIIVQVATFEQLADGTVPVVDAAFEPLLEEPFFSYDEGTKYRFSGTVPTGVDAAFTIVTSMSDLAGNTTPAGGNACVGGALSGGVDGTVPTAGMSDLVVDGGEVDPQSTPPGTGRVVATAVLISGTMLQPVVTLGDGIMDASSSRQRSLSTSTRLTKGIRTK